MSLNDFNVFNLKVTTWNCNGLKSYISYADQLVSSHHVTFICEHWLRPDELSSVKDHFSAMHF